MPATAVQAPIIADACRWYAFRVDSIDDSRPRTEIAATVVEHGTIRDFLGFNRAKHAVIEAAILATRMEFLGVTQVSSEFDRLGVIIEKTGSLQERSAFAFLKAYVGMPQRRPAEALEG
jgi:hypothetical protein